MIFAVLSFLKMYHCRNIYGEKPKYLKATKYDTSTFKKNENFLIYCTFAAKKDNNNDNNNVISNILSSLLNDETHKIKEIVICTTF